MAFSTPFFQKSLVIIFLNYVPPKICTKLFIDASGGLRNQSSCGSMVRGGGGEGGWAHTPFFDKLL